MDNNYLKILKEVGGIKESHANDIIQAKKYFDKETVKLYDYISFTQTPDFLNSKRFQRYLEHIKSIAQTAIYNRLVIQSKAIIDGNNADKETVLDYLNNIETYTVEDIVSIKVASLMFKDFDKNFNQSRHVYLADVYVPKTDAPLSFGIYIDLGFPHIDFLTKDNNTLLWNMLIDHPSEHIKGVKTSAKEIFDKSFKNAVSWWIFEKSRYLSKYGDKQVDESNYTSQCTASLMDIDSILRNTIAEMCNFITILYASTKNGSKDIINGLTDEVEKYKDTTENLYEENEDLAAENMTLSEQIKDLTKKIVFLENDKTEIVKKYSNTIKVLQKEILSLQHQIANITGETISEEKCEDDNTDELQIIIQENTPHKELKRFCDTDKKYLIVAGDIREEIKSRLLNHFPNSIVKTLDDSTAADYSKIDAAIIITKFLPHDVAYAYKNECINKNVPYVYTKSINMDSIKRDLLSYGYFKENNR